MNVRRLPYSRCLDCEHCRTHTDGEGCGVFRNYLYPCPLQARERQRNEGIGCGGVYDVPITITDTEERRNA